MTSKKGDEVRDLTWKETVLELSNVSPEAKDLFTELSQGTYKKSSNSQ